MIWLLYCLCFYILYNISCRTHTLVFRNCVPVPVLVIVSMQLLLNVQGGGGTSIQQPANKFSFPKD